MNLIPEKILKQLEELIKNKLVVTYRTFKQSDPYKGQVFIGEYGQENLIDSTSSVIKTRRPMVIEDLFKSNNEEQTRLARLMELEKIEEEFKELKRSIDNIKGILK